MRALAAYAVVGHHIVDSLRNGIAIGHFTANPQIGATGVNLFFVISGYIMMATTARRPVSPVTFLKHRIIRVAPLYWLLSTVVIVITAAGFALFNHTEISVDRVMRSFLFLPEFGASGKVTLPILFVGWTLNFEMIFYTLFALCLLAPSADARLLLGCAAIGVLWGAQMLGVNKYLMYWGSDIIIAFALGMLLWKLSERVSLHFLPAVMLIIFGLIGVALPDLITGLGSARHVMMVPDAGAALIVYGAISLESRGFNIGDGWLKRQGDASYSLYLLHPFVLRSLAKVWMTLHFAASVGGLLVMVFIMLLSSVALATGFHHIVERPITDWLRRRVDNKSWRLPAVP